jgi:hypothetical protein
MCTGQRRRIELAKGFLFHIEGDVKHASAAFDEQSNGIARLKGADFRAQRVEGGHRMIVDRVDDIPALQTAKG